MRAGGVGNLRGVAFKKKKGGVGYSLARNDRSAQDFRRSSFEKNQGKIEAGPQRKSE